MTDLAKIEFERAIEIDQNYSNARYYLGLIYNKEGNKWIWADPMNGRINISPTGDRRIIYKEGLDSWDIGVFDFESLKQKFLEFRNKYLS